MYLSKSGPSIGSTNNRYLKISKIRPRRPCQRGIIKSIQIIKRCPRLKTKIQCKGTSRLRKCKKIPCRSWIRHAFRKAGTARIFLARILHLVEICRTRPSLTIIRHLGSRKINQLIKRWKMALIFINIIKLSIAHNRLQNSPKPEIW